MTVHGYGCRKEQTDVIVLRKVRRDPHPYNTLNTVDGVLVWVETYFRTLRMAVLACHLGMDQGSALP